MSSFRRHRHTFTAAFVYFIAIGCSDDGTMNPDATGRTDSQVTREDSRADAKNKDAGVDDARRDALQQDGSAADTLVADALTDSQTDGTGADGSSDAAPPPIGEKAPIAFLADHATQGRYELFLAQGRSPGSASPLSGPSGFGQDVVSLAWSPDGKRVAYLVTTGTRRNLYLVSVNDPENPKQVHPDLDLDQGVLDFAWSPDSKYIAYQADAEVDGIFELYLVEVTQLGTATRLNPDFISGKNVTSFAWSPDSKQIAYRADQVVLSQHELYVVGVDPVDTPRQVNPVLVSGRDVEEYAWSPDGKYLAYEADLNAFAQNDLFVVPLDALGTREQVNSLLDGDKDVADFAWAPDSSGILYRADTLVLNQYELYLRKTINFNATPRLFHPVSATITTGEDVTNEYGWSPDSKQIAYIANKRLGTGTTRGRLFVTTAEDLRDGVIAAPAEDAENVDDFAWAPNGSRLAVLSDISGSDRIIYVGRLTGTDVVFGEELFIGSRTNSSLVGYSAGGSYLAFIGDAEVRGRRELFIARPNDLEGARRAHPVPGPSEDVTRAIWAP